MCVSLQDVYEYKDNDKWLYDNKTYIKRIWID